MRAGNILFSGVHFFVICLIVGLGCLFLVLPYADGLRVGLANLVLESSENFKVVGGILLGFGVILFLGLYLLNRKGFLRVEMEGAKIDVEEGVIKRSVLTYFQELFPGEDLVSDVVVKGKRSLEIITSLSGNHEDDFFERVERDLGGILARRYGYNAPFTVIFSES